MSILWFHEKRFLFWLKGLEFSKHQGTWFVRNVKVQIYRNNEICNDLKNDKNCSLVKTSLRQMLQGSILRFMEKGSSFDSKVWIFPNTKVLDLSETSKCEFIEMMEFATISKMTKAAV